MTTENRTPDPISAARGTESPSAQLVELKAQRRQAEQAAYETHRQRVVEVRQ